MDNMGNRIRLLRKQHNMTQEELGAKIGVNKAAISKYEKGQVENMKRSTIKMLADLFGVSPTYLLGWDDEHEQSKIADEVKAFDVVGQVYGERAAKMLELFSRMNSDGQERILEFIKDMNQVQKYRKDDEQ